VKQDQKWIDEAKTMKNIFIIEKWYKDINKFNILNEYLTYKNIENYIDFKESASAIKIIVDESKVNCINNTINAFFNPLEVGRYYTFCDNCSVDLDKNLIAVNISNVFPEFYEVKLINKEKYEANAYILKDNEIFGLIKFNPKRIKISSSPIIICNSDNINKNF